MKQTNKNTSMRLTDAASSLYLVLMLVILPLYMRDGINMLGDAKYTFYAGTFLLCVVVSVIAIIIDRTRNKISLGKLTFSTLDKWALDFGAASVLSFLVSEYKEVALWGYQDWYMGLLTQLSMVIGYLLISRLYDGNKWIWGVAACTAAVISALGVLNRYEFDPLNVFDGLEVWDWARTNMLATIGNINWFCGYLCVSVPFLLYFFWNGKSTQIRCVTGLGSLLGMGAMLIQGSESGYAALAVMLIILLYASLKDSYKLQNFLQVTALLPFFCLLMTFYTGISGRGLMLPEGSSAGVIVSYKMWIEVLAVTVLLWALLFWYHKRTDRDILENGKIYKAACIAGTVLIMAAILFVVGCQFSDKVWSLTGKAQVLRFQADWGGERGFLWNAAIQGFMDNNILKNIFGVGPDCFASYMYSHYAMNVQVTGQWQGAVYANAHNEWLNMLVNEGVVGLIAYAGFFFTAFVSFQKDCKNHPELIVGMMAIGAYAVNNIFSFQQIVSTPLIFLVIGMCQRVKTK